MTSVSRLTWASERSRWKGVGATFADRQRRQDLPVAAQRVAEDREDRAAVLLDLRRNSSTGAGGEPEATSSAGNPLEASLAFFLRGGIVSKRPGYIVTAGCDTTARALADHAGRRSRGPAEDRAVSAAHGAAPLRAPGPGRRRRHRRLGQAREPQPDQLLQGPQRPLQDDRHAGGRAGSGGRRRHARQPRAGSGLRGRPARNPRHDLRSGREQPGEERGNARARRGARRAGKGLRRVGRCGRSDSCESAG